MFHNTPNAPRPIKRASNGGISTNLHPWTAKLLWFLLPSLLGASVWWYVVSQTLQGRVAFTSAGLTTLLTFIVFGLFSFGLWVSGLGLSTYLANWRIVRFVSAGIVSLPLMAFFPPQPLTVGLAVGLWLVLWWGAERFATDAHSRLQLKPHLSSGWAFPTVIVLVMVVVSLLYYQQLRGATRTASELSARLASQTVGLLERFIPLLTKEYRPDMTVDEVIGLQIPTAAELLKDIQFDALNQTELEERLRQTLASVEGFDAQQFSLGPTANQTDLERQLETQLEQARRQLSEQVRQSLSSQFGVPISGQATAHDVLTDIVNHQFNRYLSRYVTVIPWLLAVALFFILRVFSGLFLIATTWLGWLLFWLYRHLHIIHLTHETVPAERVEWSH
ncbi:MAG: hypothetical protein HYY50_02135 [Candidatus Kerfeldbacteria bacterium]|nr:hypothetical protein [Candidatus Kerfeldbacteria bacterium]